MKLVNVENVLLQFDTKDQEVTDDYVNTLLKWINFELSRSFQISQPTISLKKESKIKIIEILK